MSDRDEILRLKAEIAANFRVIGEKIASSELPLTKEQSDAMLRSLEVAEKLDDG